MSFPALIQNNDSAQLLDPCHYDSRNKTVSTPHGKQPATGAFEEQKSWGVAESWLLFSQ